MSVNSNIVAARKAKGITQKALSEMTGIPIQTIVRYEKEGGNITARKLRIIADALNVKAMDLLGWETDEKKGLDSYSTEELLAEIAKRC